MSRHVCIPRVARITPPRILAALLLFLGGCGGGVTEPAARPRNLLLITVDTLRADHLGAYGYPRSTSPSLDAFAEEAVVFENAHATSSWTLSSLASLLTSLYTSSHGCWGNQSTLGPGFETLGEVLSTQGFDTAAFVTHFFLDRRYGLDQGFDLYDQDLVASTAQESHLAISSPPVTEKAVAWLDRRRALGEGAPWFLWVHYFDPHANYLFHEGVSAEYGTPSPWGVSHTKLDMYDGEIAFTDHHIGALLDALDASGFGDETVVVFVADHGEEFGEHGRYGHRRHLHREVVQVPLMIRAPGVVPRRVREIVSILDVFPTALALLGIHDGGLAHGRNLSAALLGGAVPTRAVLAELKVEEGNRIQMTSISDGRWKLILDALAGESELYDLERDPSELQDVSAENPTVVGRLRKEMRLLVLQAVELGDLHGRGGELELSPEDLQRLRDLGYVGEND
jgi:arylsulfatase A-like enzyme